MKVKTTILIHYFIISVVMLTMSSSCKKENNASNTTPDGAIIFNPDLQYDSVADIDGNVYKTILIGSQTWMAENLRTTRFNDSTEIPFVTDKVQWNNISTPGYCWYNNDDKYKNIFGALYNWTAVESGKLAPVGWHVASDAEWTKLTNFLSGPGLAGGKIKEAGTTHWTSPNAGATNESGFTALPGGDRTVNGEFSLLTNYALFWSSSEGDTLYAWCRDIGAEARNIIRYKSNKINGFSVRCIKD